MNDASSRLAAKSALTDRQLMLLNSEMSGRSKSLLLAYVLWHFFSILGIYRFYLGDSKGGWRMVIATIAAIVLLIVLVGLVVLLGLVVVWIIDAVRMPARVREVNEEIERQIIAELTAVSGETEPQAA